MADLYYMRFSPVPYSSLLARPIRNSMKILKINTLEAVWA